MCLNNNDMNTDCSSAYPDGATFNIDDDGTIKIEGSRTDYLLGIEPTYKDTHHDHATFIPDLTFKLKF